MTRTRLMLLAAGGSALLLAGAFAFQFAGYAPCPLCIWQRWPHAAAILLGAVAIAVPNRIVAIAGAFAAGTAAALGFYHAGVEYGWWEGPTSCTSASVAGLSPEELMDRILAAPLVRCDEVVWSLAGVSMAGWNAILSSALALLWIVAARAPERPQN